MSESPLRRLVRTFDRIAADVHRRRQQRAEQFDAADFRRMLEDFGIERGDVLLVHSAMDGFFSFQGKMTEIIDTLIDVVGPEGTLMMPTQPFTGSSVDYAEQAGIFDIRKTPSEMGLISEFFRRRKDVTRSLHPTHPVAIWGARIPELIRDHHLSETPCGDGTPFIRFGELDGKILLLGTGINVLTYYHGLEEDLERLMPWSPFTEEVYALQSRTADGEIVETRNRLFEPDLSGRRDMRLVIPYFKARGIWRDVHLGSLHAIFMNARDLKSVVYAMAHHRRYVYHAHGGRPYKLYALMVQRLRLALRPSAARIGMTDGA